MDIDVRHSGPARFGRGGGTQSPLGPRPAPVPLESLARGVARLWEREPQVSEELRIGLFEALGELDHRIDVLILRTETGSPLDPVEIRNCAQRYLWLRENWAESENAA